jgi:hypothetical protein
VLGQGQRSQNLSLAIPCNHSIAGECRQNLFMAEVLAPGLERFRRLAQILPKPDKRVPEAVRNYAKNLLGWAIR